MIVLTAEVQRFLESKGFTRDKSEPFTYVGYEGDNQKIFVLEEFYGEQDIEMLIEDAESDGASGIALALREWLQKLEDGIEKPKPSPKQP